MTRQQFVVYVLVMCMAGFTACCRKGGGVRSNPSAKVSKEQAEEIAIRNGTEAGYSAEQYRLVKIELDEKTGHWWADFEHTPPTPPGGHYSVEIDSKTGEARLIHGE